MEFTYSVTIDDLLRYGEHMFRTTRIIRWMKHLCSAVVPLFFASWALQHYWESLGFDWVFFMIRSLALTSAIFLPRYLQRSWLKEIYRQLVASPVAGDCGIIRLVITDESVTEIAPSRQIKLGWNQVSRIEILPDCIYVYAGLKGVIIIPRHSFTSEIEYERLKLAILHHGQNTDA